MSNKGIKHTGIKLKPDSSWKDKVGLFKPKAKKRYHSDLVDCKGVICKAKDSVFTNKAPKGEECPRCFNEAFKNLRYKPQSETPNFDAQFLTRLDLA